MPDDYRDFLNWTPFVGSLGYMATKLAQEGSLDRLGRVWQRGQRAGQAMQSYLQELSQQTAASLLLPKDLTPQQEAYILDVVRHRTGTRERLAHIQSLRELEALRESLPEVYHEAHRQAWSLRQVDPSRLLMGQALEEAIPETASFLTTEYIRPSKLPQLLQDIEASRQAGRFVDPFMEMREAFQEAFQLSAAHVEAVKRKIKQTASQEVEQLIALRISGGGVAVEIPVLTAQREFITRTGAVYMPAFWELGEREIAPDVRILEELTKALHQAPTVADPQAYLDDVVKQVARRSVYEVNERARDITSPIAKLWLRGRAVVPGTTPQEIARQREAVARQAWSLARQDRTSWLPPGSTVTGIVGRRRFRAEEWSLSGRLVDDKAYKTFAKPMPLAQESIAFLQQERGHGRLAQLLTPAAAPKGYYEAAQSTGERLLSLTYGMIEADDLEKLEEGFRLTHKGKYDRRLFLKMTEDEMLAAAELKDAWKAERVVTYTLDETHGVSSALQAGAELSPGEFLGVTPLGKPAYAGRRGGKEIVDSIQRLEGKVIVRVRNLIEMQPGTKVFGTGGLKHTVRQAMRLSNLQALYEYYLTNFKNVSPEEAAQIARNITAITIKKSFKNPEQEVDQLLASLATYQQEMLGRPEAEEAAQLLRRFGFQPAADTSIAAWERVDFSMSPEEIYQNFRAARQFDPEGVLAAAARRTGLLRSEIVRMGPPMQDLGAGNLGTFSMEMANVLFDQGHERLATHLMSRLEPENQQVLRGLVQMLEPFEGGGRRFGTAIEDLTAQQIMSGEQGVADWLAHRGQGYPKEGIIHFSPYELKSGQQVSYLKLPDETLAALKGVYLEDGRTAASVLQRSFYRTLQKIRADVLHQPGTPSYQEATQALQDYFDTLGKLIMGKGGAARGVIRGKVSHSLQLQAASLFSGLPRDPATQYVTNEAMEEMLRGLSAAREAEVLRVVDPQGRYSSLLEAFRAGEPLPGISARYPGESSYAAMPVRFRSAEWARRQVQMAEPTFGRFTLNPEQVWIDPELFKLMVGDYDSDIAHLYLATSREAAEDILQFTSQGGPEKYIQHWQEMLRTTSVKGKAQNEFTNSLVRILAQQRRQQAGKADIGIISNAMDRIRRAARQVGRPEIADWTQLITESLTIKAKHISLDELAQAHNPERLLAHLEGTGLGMDLESRTRYLMDLVSQVAPPESLPIHQEHIREALMAYDQSYRRSAWDRFTRLLKRPAAQATGTDALKLVRQARQVTNDELGAMLIGAALDKGGWRTRAQSRLAGVTAVAREAKGMLGKHAKWLGLGLAASAGLAILRKPTPLTPEKVTGEDLMHQGALMPAAPAVSTPPPTARISPRTPPLRVRVQGRSSNDLQYQQLGQQLSQITNSSTRVVVDNRSKRLDREDLRRLRRS